MGRSSCHSCGGGPLPRGARWCPRCGVSLRAGPGAHAAEAQGGAAGIGMTARTTVTAVGRTRGVAGPPPVSADGPQARPGRTPGTGARLARSLRQPGLLLPALAVVAIAAVLIIGDLELAGGSSPDLGRDPAGAAVDLPEAGTAAPGGGPPGPSAGGTPGVPGGQASPGTQPGEAAEQPPDDTTDQPRDQDGRAPTCDTSGCARWRSTVLDHQPILIAGGRLVQVRFEELVAVDEATGRWLWRKNHEDMRMWDPAQVVTAFHLDDRTLALAYGTRVRIHAASTGRVLGEVDLSPTRVTDLRRHDGQLVATGRLRATGETGVHLVGLTDGGDIRFDTEVARLVREDRPATSTTAPLLAVADDHLRRLDATDGRTRWQHELGGRQVDGTTLLDPDTGEVVVLSARDGTELLARTRPGAVAAGVRDGVLAITMPDRIELYDRDGTALGAVAVSEPARAVVAAAGRRIVVAELPEGGESQRTALTLRTGRRAGGSTALPTITAAASAPLPPDRRPDPVEVMRRSDGIVLAGPDPRDAWLVDPVSTTATPLDLPTAPTREVVHRGGISLVRDGTQLHVIGAAGRFTVEHATQIATVEPLILHGVHGTLRLHRDLLDGGPEGRQAPVGPAGELRAAPRQPPQQRHGLGLAR